MSRFAMLSKFEPLLRPSRLFLAWGWAPSPRGRGDVEGAGVMEEKTALRRAEVAEVGWSQCNHGMGTSLRPS